MMLLQAARPDWAHFAHWAIIFFGPFFESCRRSPNVWSAFFHGKKLCFKFDKKWFGLRFVNISKTHLVTLVAGRGGGGSARARGTLQAGE
jgi:hypothetical protein